MPRNVTRTENVHIYQAKWTGENRQK